MIKHVNTLSLNSVLIKYIKSSQLIRNYSINLSNSSIRFDSINNENKNINNLVNSNARQFSKINKQICSALNNIHILNQTFQSNRFIHSSISTQSQSISFSIHNSVNSNLSNFQFNIRRSFHSSSFPQSSSTSNSSNNKSSIAGTTISTSIPNLSVHDSSKVKIDSSSSKLLHPSHLPESDKSSTLTPSRISSLLSTDANHIKLFSDPIHIALLGAPGVGKGTYAQYIGPYLRIPHISTGELVRNEIKSNSKLGKSIKEDTSNGKLLSDEIMTNLLSNRLKKDDCKYNGFLLDGYPRRISQAKALDEQLKLINNNNFNELDNKSFNNNNNNFDPLSNSSSSHQVDLVLELKLPIDILVEKTVARRVCSNPKCNKNYNLADINRNACIMPPMLPLIDNKCDKCNSKLIKRSDDNKDIVLKRLELYNNETHPLIEYYKNQNKLITWNVKLGMKDLPNIIKLCQESLKQRGKK